MILFLKLISRLPLSILYILSYKLYFLMYYVVGYRKKVILENMSNAFPDQSPAEIKQLAKRFYLRFSDFIVETLKGITISEKELKKRVKIKNPEVLDKYINQDQSMLFMVSHQFNWEWAILISCLELPFQVDVLYKKLSHAKMDKMVFEARSRFGAYMIEKNTSVREIVSRGKVLTGTAISADQLPVQSSPSEKYWANFLNQDTAFFVGGERIAKLLKAPVFFLGMRSTKRGHYEIEFTELASPPYVKTGHQVLESYVRETEKLILSEPAGWLWSHKRWKYKRPVETE